ncbi:MAG TPA: ABC transporter [Cyanobacteria bacterium UBA12227]|nr:ABC transporter [Cyanobacteria bacterium UBA12227]HAX86065.1 ABC transporter [Cyanobacteria bacterium UBA11370]HBY79185.1 ABC transporter [Cyanobacteria bacterium UBA11148]
MIHNSHISQLEPDSALDLNVRDRRITKTCVRVRIPKRYQQEPVLSNLISQQGLKVNIKTAILGTVWGGNAQGDGWFDLQLQGTVKQIDSALIYLSDLDIEVWHESSDE